MEAESAAPNTVLTINAKIHIEMEIAATNAKMANNTKIKMEAQIVVVLK